MKPLKQISLSIGCVTLTFILLLAGCIREKTNEAENGEYRVSEKDSINIVNTANEIMAMLQDNDIDGAAARLRLFNRSDSTVSPLSDNEIKMLRRRQSIFPVKQFEMIESDFEDAYNNLVVYKVVFGSKSSVTGEAPTTKMAFNAVCVNGEYFVTVKENR